MKKLIVGGIAMIAVCFVVAAGAADKDPLAGVKCPISGKKVVKTGVADYKGGKVYFCCTNCPKAFAANTKKYAAKANHQLVLTGQAKQVKCPLKGKSAKASISVKVGGVSVGLCCPGCKKKASSAEGDALVNLLFNDAAFKKGFAIAKKKP